MAEFATIDELAQFTKADIVEQDQPRASLLLQMAASAIQGEARQKLELVVDDEVTLQGNWSQKLWLPERPVVALSSVKIGTAPELSSASYEWRRSGLVRLVYWDDPDWDDPSRGGIYWGGERAIAVTYSHGYEVIPDDIKGVCLAGAARLFDNPTGDSSEQIGGYQAAHTVEFTEIERKVIRRYRQTTL